LRGKRSLRGVIQRMLASERGWSGRRIGLGEWYRDHWCRSDVEQRRLYGGKWYGENLYRSEEGRSRVRRRRVALGKLMVGAGRSEVIWGGGRWAGGKILTERCEAG